ncbi:MAG: NIL domain-containing protein [Candidatus Aenigmatarchaeota archaeon]
MAKKKVELNIPGTLKDEPFFYYIIKNFEVVPKILEASFSTEMGWAIVEFEGKDDELKRLFSFLEKKGVEVSTC